MQLTFNNLSLIIPEIKDLDQLFLRLSKDSKLAISVVPYGALNSNIYSNSDTEIIGYGLYFGDKDSFFVYNSPKQLEMLKPILQDEKVIKIGYNFSQFDAVLLYFKYGIFSRNIKDVYLLGRILYPDGINGSLELKDLSKQLLGIDTDFLYSSRKLFNREDFLLHGAYKSWVIWQLYSKLESLISDASLITLFDELTDIQEILFLISINGIKVDPKIYELANIFKSEIEMEMERIYQIAGTRFNINSNQQLAEILFKQRGNKPVRLSEKTGLPIVDEYILKDLSSQDTLASAILRYRELHLFYKTYIENLIKSIHNGRVHSRWGFNTESFRISSSEPNLQGVPAKEIEIDGGKIKIKNLFIPEKGYRFVQCDLDQIEMRILAHLSEDPCLIDIFKTGRDLHSEVAKEIFGLSCSPREIKEKYPEFRKKAKGINFGIIYGRGPKSLAQELNISEIEAQQYIENWFNKFKKVKDYEKRIISQLLYNGTIVNLFGITRIFNIKDTSNLNSIIREAKNWVIQSSAAILCHKSLRTIYNYIQEQKIDALVVLHLHDGVVFETAISDIEKLIKIMKDVFAGWHLRVPILAEYKILEKWD